MSYRLKAELISVHIEEMLAIDISYVYTKAFEVNVELFCEYTNLEKEEENRLKEMTHTYNIKDVM